MKAETIQVPEISFAGPSPQAQDAKKPSQDFQQVLDSSVESSRTDGPPQKNEIPALRQGEGEKKTCKECEAPPADLSSPTTAAAAAIMAMENTQVSLRQDVPLQLTSDGASTEAVGALTAGSGTNAAVVENSMMAVPTGTEQQSGAFAVTQPEIKDAADASEVLMTEQSSAFSTNPAQQTQGKQETPSKGAVIEPTAKEIPLSSLPEAAVGEAEKNQPTQAEQTAEPPTVSNGGNAPATEKNRPEQPAEMKLSVPAAAPAETSGVQKNPLQVLLKKTAEYEPAISTVAEEQSDSAFKTQENISPILRQEIPQSQKAKNPVEPIQTVQSAQAAVLPQGQTQQTTQKTQGSVQAEVPLAAQQIAQGADKALKEGRSEFRLNLKPEGLGQVTVNMTCEKGRVILDIQAESGTTQKLISEQIGKLTADLSAGRYETVQVRISGQTPGFTTQNSFSQGGGGRRDYSRAGYRENSPQEQRENAATPLRFYTGGMLNCTA